uniref:Uncharacterized protein n=1 Tax=Haemonchus contortus TaxID=6289 RepID=W6NFM1_HAECO
MGSGLLDQVDEFDSSQIASNGRRVGKDHAKRYAPVSTQIYAPKDRSVPRLPCSCAADIVIMSLRTITFARVCGVEFRRLCAVTADQGHCAVFRWI